MRAIVRDEYGSPDVLSLADVEKPVPGGNDLLVKIHAASINTADVDYMRGLPVASRLGTGLFKPKNRVLGLDLAGTVEAVGENVDGFEPGDEVWADLSGNGFGAFAEYACAPEAVFAHKPIGVTFEEAATVPHSAVLALQGLRGKRPIKPGHKVLINGAGGCVGPFAVQIAKSMGAEVTGVDAWEKLEMLRALGVDHVIDYKREDFTKNGQRYDFILDIAARHSVIKYMRALSPTGSYVLIAHSLFGFMQAFFIGLGISAISRKRMGIFMWYPSKRKDLDDLRGLLENEEIKPLIDRRVELSEVPEALQYMEEGKARGKVVVALSGASR